MLAGEAGSSIALSCSGVRSDCSMAKRCEGGKTEDLSSIIREKSDILAGWKMSKGTIGESR